MPSHNETIIDQHSLQASYYAQLTNALAMDRTGALCRLVGVRSDDDLLDVACGPGSLAIELAPHVASATGLDLTPAMLAEARLAGARSRCHDIMWIEGDAAALPLADGNFSLVASRAAFHHFERPEQVLSEMVRVCRPGGRVVVIDVTPDAEKTTAYDRMERMRDPSHGHAHSFAELRAMGDRLGLGEPQLETRMSGPMPFQRVLDTSFPDGHSREELLELMREDAATGEDRLGFRAEMADGQVMVTYPMSTIVWTRP
jgi:SAM-dependent methyltransferase